MTTSATTGYGCLIKIGDGAGSETFTTIPEAKGFQMSGLTAGTVEVTNFDSANATREFIATLIDGGTISFTCNYLPDSAIQTQLKTDLVARTRRNFKLVFTDNTPQTMSFSGLITNFAPTGALEGPLELAVSIKISGLPTWA